MLFIKSCLSKHMIIKEIFFFIRVFVVLKKKSIERQHQNFYIVRLFVLFILPLSCPLCYFDP